MKSKLSDVVMVWWSRSGSVIKSTVRKRFSAAVRNLDTRAAKAAGIGAIDTTYVDLEDLDGLRSEAIECAGMGFDGEATIHPSHVTVINNVFRPDDASVDHGRRLVEAFDAAGVSLAPNSVAMRAGAGERQQGQISSEDAGSVGAIQGDCRPEPVCRFDHRRTRLVLPRAPRSYPYHLETARLNALGSARSPIL